MSTDDVHQRLEALNSDLSDTRELLIGSVAIQSALTNVLINGKDPLRFAKESAEHGHLLLISLLLTNCRNKSFAGKTLVEIGSTRERIPVQSSTSKLAILCDMLGITFTTVDMDPASQATAQRLLWFFGASHQAVCARGEDFLSTNEDGFDFIYLDAFDFDHGQHSEHRKSRYREYLGVEISDKACWAMHLNCAEAAVKGPRMPELIVLDDTWMDAGEFAGKGTLAVPFLLKSGFRIVGSTEMAVALSPTIAAASTGQMFSPGIWWIGLRMNRSGSDVQSLQMDLFRAT